jgi:hypothetical protein
MLLAKLMVLGAVRFLYGVGYANAKLPTLDM